MSRLFRCDRCHVTVDAKANRPDGWEALEMGHVWQGDLCGDCVKDMEYHLTNPARTEITASPPSREEELRGSLPPTPLSEAVVNKGLMPLSSAESLLLPNRTRRKKDAPPAPVNEVASVGAGTTPARQGPVARFYDALVDVECRVRELQDAQVRSRWVAYHVHQLDNGGGGHAIALADCRAELCGEYQKMKEGK